MRFTIGSRFVGRKFDLEFLVLESSSFVEEIFFIDCKRLFLRNLNDKTKFDSDLFGIRSADSALNRQVGQHSEFEFLFKVLSKCFRIQREQNE
jgi:hypothetical protein